MKTALKLTAIIFSLCLHEKVDGNILLAGETEKKVGEKTTIKTKRRER